MLCSAGAGEKVNVCISTTSFLYFVLSSETRKRAFSVENRPEVVHGTRLLSTAQPDVLSAVDGAQWLSMRKLVLHLNLLRTEALVDRVPTWDGHGTQLLSRLRNIPEHLRATTRTHAKAKVRSTCSGLSNISCCTRSSNDDWVLVSVSGYEDRGSECRTQEHWLASLQTKKLNS